MNRQERKALLLLCRNLERDDWNVRTPQELADTISEGLRCVLAWGIMHDEEKENDRN